MKQAPIEIHEAAMLELAQEKRLQPNVVLAARKRVFEFASSGQRGRAGGHDVNIGEMIRGDFKNGRRIQQSMDLVEDDELPSVVRPEKLGILKLPTDGRELAIIIVGAPQSSTQRRLPRTANARQPNDRTPLETGFDALSPKRAVKRHKSIIAIGLTKRHYTF